MLFEVYTLYRKLIYSQNALFMQKMHIHKATSDEEYEEIKISDDELKAFLREEKEFRGRFKPNKIRRNID
jgi:hypothetical protein